MRLWLGIGIFVIVVLAAFALFVFHISESTRPNVAGDTTTAPISDVTTTDSFGSGIHTIHGSATVPSACTTLSATSSVEVATDASSSPVIRIDLSAPRDTGLCLMRPTEIPFTFRVQADEGASIVVYANGELATSTGE